MRISLGLHLFGGKRRTAGTTMAPLTKDAVEVTNSATEASGSTPGASGKTEQAGNLRADAVSLEVPVKVHGSRVTEVVREVTPHTEPFEEQTNTMIVFPQGAVIRMSTSVNVGQMLVVTNLKSRQDAICRVVKVRTFSNLQGYVEVEFTHKQPGYWSVYFPSEGPAIVNKPAQPAAVEPAVPAVKKTPVSSASDISWAPAPSANASEEKPAEEVSFSTAVKPPIAPPQIVSPAKAEPSFISIGRQEQVQAAASTIVTAPPAVSNFEAPKKAPAQANASSVISFPPTPVVEAPSITSLPELHEAVPAVTSAPEFQSSTGGSAAERSQSVASASDETVRSSFGSLSGGATLSTRAASAAAHEGESDYTGASAHSKTPSGRNWTLIAVCITLLFAIVGGGVFYIRTQSASSSAKSNPPAVTQPDAAANLNAPQTRQATAASPQVSNSGRAAIANKPANIIANGNAAAETHDSAVSSNRPSTPAKEDAPHVTSDMMNATLNSHPVSSQRTGGGQEDVAPSLDAAAEPPSSTTGALPGVMGSSDVASPPAPEIRPEGPVKIGGQVKEPKLLSSTLPVYPAFAKEAHVEGDVVIRTTIDKNGSVTHMEIVSGPTMLRQAALDALGRWKYVPSKLDGQPVSVQMLVTIKFHR
jgi:periplasmic protein TonB